MLPNCHVSDLSLTTASHALVSPQKVGKNVHAGLGCPDGGLSSRRRAGRFVGAYGFLAIGRGGSSDVKTCGISQTRGWRARLK